MPVLGDVAHTDVADVEDAPTDDRGPLELDRAGGRRPEPDQGFGELALAVALDAGDAEDLARSNLEVDAVQLPLTGEPLDPKDRLADLDRRLLEPEQDRPADHHLGELGLRGVGRACLPDDPPAAEDRDAVRDLHDLVELVADEHDGPSRLPELPQVAEQVLRLVRGEHRRRLVQDQDLDTPVEGLQDLDALFLADREVLDDGARIDSEGVRLGELGDALPRGVDIETGSPLLAEDDVLGDREGIDEHEVLVDHADPERDGVSRRADLHLLAPHADAAAVRRVHAVEHPHQSRLAGPVLADQRMDLARPELEVDLVVGQHAREALGDALERDEGRGAAAPRPFAVRHGCAVPRPRRPGCPARRSFRR